MGRFQDGQHYPTLTGFEIIPGLQFGQAEDGWFFSRDLINLADLAGTVPGTTYTFTTGDEQRVTEFTSSSSVVASIAADNVSLTFDIGDHLRPAAIGTGRVKLLAAPGVTVRWPKDNTGADCQWLRTINSEADLRKRGANDWHAIGDLSAT